MVLIGDKINDKVMEIPTPTSFPIRFPVPVPPKFLRLRRLVLPVLEEYVVKGQILEKDCDVTFCCEGGQVKAHKIILALVSDFFSKIFKNQDEPSVVLIPDIKLDVLEAIIKLCYNQEVKLDDDIVPHVAQWLNDFGLQLENFTLGGQLNFEEIVLPTSTSSFVKQLTESTSPLTRNSRPDNDEEAIKEAQNNNASEEQEDVGSESKENNVQNENFQTISGPTFWLDMESFGPTSFVPLVAPQTPTRTLPATIHMPKQHTVSSLTKAVARVQKVPVMNHQTVKPGGDQIAHAQAQVRKELRPLMQPEINLVPMTQPGLRTTTTTTAIPRILKGSEKVTGKRCPVCSYAFSNDAQWKWHTERHLKTGQFKCTVCRRTFNTSRTVYKHEMNIHKLMGFDTPVPSTEVCLKLEAGEKALTDTQLKLKQVATVIQSNVRNQTVTPVKLRVASSSQKSSGKSGRKPKWKIEKVPSSDQGSTNTPQKAARGKIRWVYVCKKCKHTSDSSVKAFAHHVKCSPESKQNYQETIIRCRQGHYGDYQCPLCSKQYSSIYGFVVHSMHSHKEYRRGFSHVINQDKLLCTHCGATFPTPKDFHAHLNDDTHQCERPVRQMKKPYRRILTRRGSTDSTRRNSGPPVLSRETMGKSIASASESLGHETNINLESESSNSVRRPLKRKLYQNVVATAVKRGRPLSKMLSKRNPRSVRLQDHLTDAATSQEGKLKQLIEVNCAVCGFSNDDLKHHLDIHHPELGMDIEIVEESIFRCKLCSISFDACDLLNHHRSCIPSELALDPVLEIPENVGVSPVEQMGTEDLMAIETIREALKCPVCKREAKKLHVISECLRSHGIYRCTLCFSTFSSKADHTEHMTICHMNEVGQIVCPICHSRRSNIGQVTSHVYLSHWANFFKSNASRVRGEASTAQTPESTPSVRKEDTADAEQIIPTVVELGRVVEEENKLKISAEPTLD